MSENKARGPMMGGHRSRAMNSGEKAKDFKGAMKRLLKYMERYKFRFVLMFLFAIAGTIFNIVGPKILGKATTELFNGLVAKVNGTGSIDFEKIGYILLWTLGLYLASACFSFIQGYVMTGISNDVTYNLRKDISKKFSRLPMNYYESRTNGEILSRVTNDVDTLQMSLNQSITQLITSVTTDRCICDDAVHQCVDDPGCPSDPSDVYAYHQFCYEALPEIFPGTAEVSGGGKWPD